MSCVVRESASQLAGIHKYAGDPESTGITQTTKELIVNAATKRLLRRKQVEEKTGLSCSSIYQAMQEGTFPKPISIGPRAVAWIENEIESWIEQKIRLARG